MIDIDQVHYAEAWFQIYAACIGSGFTAASAEKNADEGLEKLKERWPNGFTKGRVQTTTPVSRKSANRQAGVSDVGKPEVRRDSGSDDRKPLSFTNTKGYPEYTRPTNPVRHPTPWAGRGTYRRGSDC